MTGSTIAAADEAAVSDSTPATCDQRSAAQHIKQARGTINAGLSKKNWRNGLKRSQHHRIRDHLDCLERAKDRKKIKRHQAERKARWRLFHAYRSIATQRGFSGEGYWLRWLVIPRWVVAAETNGYHGAGRWRATNPSSGACGPYQLNGHTSCDTSSAADKLRHHQVAAGLPRGSWEVGY